VMQLVIKINAIAVSSCLMANNFMLYSWRDAMYKD
jgi:hypothetical protein